MKEWVVLDVGCMECGRPTHVIGVFNSEHRATEVALNRLNTTGRDSAWGTHTPHATLAKPTYDWVETTLRWWGQNDSSHSVEVHLVGGESSGVPSSRD